MKMIIFIIKVFLSLFKKKRKIKKEEPNKKEKNDLIKTVTKINPNKKEIFVCVNNLSVNNKELIKKLIHTTKVLNIVTENNSFFNFEKELYNQNIFITVSKNKRLALKKAEFIINIDFTDFTTYNLYRNATIISLITNPKFQKSFEGKIIKFET